MRSTLLCTAHVCLCVYVQEVVLTPAQSYLCGSLAPCNVRSKPGQLEHVAVKGVCAHDAQMLVHMLTYETVLRSGHSVHAFSSQQDILRIVNFVFVCAALLFCVQNQLLLIPATALACMVSHAMA